MLQLGRVLSAAWLLYEAGGTYVPTELAVLPSFVTGDVDNTTRTSAKIVHGRCEFRGDFPTAVTFALYEAMLRALSEVATSIAVLDQYTLLERNDTTGISEGMTLFYAVLPSMGTFTANTVTAFLIFAGASGRPPRIQQMFLEEVGGDAEIGSLSTSSWSFECPWSQVKIKTVEVPYDNETGVPWFTTTTTETVTSVTTVTSDTTPVDAGGTSTSSGPGPTETTTASTTTTTMACPTSIRLNGGGAERSRPKFFGNFEKTEQATGALNGFRPIYKNSHQKELYYWAKHQLWIISHEGGSDRHVGVVFVASDSHCPHEVASPWMVWSEERSLWEEFPVEVFEVTTTTTTTTYRGAYASRREGLGITEKVVLAAGVVVFVAVLCVAIAYWIHYLQEHRTIGGSWKHKVRVVKDMGHAATITSMDSMDSTDLGFNHHPVHEHNHEAGPDHASRGGSFNCLQPEVRSVSKQSNASSKSNHSDGTHHASLHDMRMAYSPRRQNRALTDSAESSSAKTQASPRVADSLRQAANHSPRSEASSRASRAHAHKDLARGVSDDSHIPGMIAGHLDPSPKGSLMPCSTASTRGPSKDSRRHSGESGLSHVLREQPSSISERQSSSNLAIPGHRNLSFREQSDHVREVGSRGRQGHAQPGAQPSLQ